MIEIEITRVYVKTFIPNPQSTILYFNQYSELYKFLDYTMETTENKTLKMLALVDEDNNEMIELTDSTLIVLGGDNDKKNN